MNKSATLKTKKVPSKTTKPPPASPSPKASEFQVGERVFLLGLKRWATVKFIGETKFSDGVWIGAELGDMIGRNDGSVQGHRYFTCKPNHGVFIRPKSCVRGDKNTPALRPHVESQDSIGIEQDTTEDPFDDINPDDSGDFAHTPPVRKITSRIGESTEKPKLRSRTSVGKKASQIGASSVINKTQDDKIMKRLTSALTSGSRTQPLVSPRQQESPDARPSSRSGTPVQRSLTSPAPSSDEIAAKVMELVLNSSVLSNLISNKCDDATKELKSEIASLKSAPNAATPSTPSNMEHRIQHVENSMGDIYCRLSDILEAMNKLASTVANGAMSNTNGGDHVSEDVQEEIAQLKGTLAMVSNLAKEAHEATLKERQTFQDRIAQLEAQVQG